MGFLKNYDQLTTTPQRKIVLDILEAGISAIQPNIVMSSGFIVQGSNLKVMNHELNLANFNNIYLIGFGKSSSRIAKIIEQKLGNKLTEGYVIDVAGEQFSKIQETLGTHPLPSQTNIDFTKKVVERFQGRVTERDLVLVVVTGGGSALFELPTVSSNELLRINDELLKSGKTIQEMNEERKKYSRVKGGKLAQLLKPAKVLGLIFSDVPGNDLSVVASGPTVDGSTENILALSNKTALDAMKKKGEELGLHTTEYDDQLQGEARAVGSKLVKVVEPNSVLLAGGETTVTVQNPNGKGGRNQELVLGALLNNELSSYVTIASFDSDGWDNTEFGGAIGDVHTLERAKSMNYEPTNYLTTSNSFEFFQKVGDGIITGRLQSNVADLMIIFRK